MWTWVTAAALSLPLDAAHPPLDGTSQLMPEGLDHADGIQAASIAAAIGVLFLAAEEGDDPTAMDPKESADAYVDKLAPVLLAGVEPQIRTFLQQSVAGEAPFSIALDFGCLKQQGMSNTSIDGLTRWNDPAITCHAGGGFGTADARHIVSSPGVALPGGVWWYGDGAWRQKYAAEAWIPQLIQKSVWNHGHRPGRPSMIMPVLFAACMEIRDHYQFCNGMPYDDKNEKSQIAFGQILDTTGMPVEDSATVFTADYGPCMSGNLPCADKPCQALTKRTVLANFGEHGTPECFNPAKDVVIPTSTLVNPTDEAAKLSFVNATDLTVIAKSPDSGLHTLRTRLAYFPRGHAFPARKQLYDFYQGDPDVKVVAREEHALYLNSLFTSKFCIQADGMAAWSPRLAEFLAVGCVPVLISDRLIPPLFRTLDFTKFAVMHTMKDLTGLKPRLQGLVADGTYDKMLANVLLVRSAFVYDQRAQGVQMSGVLPMIMFEMALLHTQRKKKAEGAERADSDNKDTSDDGSDFDSDDDAADTLPQQRPPLPATKRKRKKWLSR